MRRGILALGATILSMFGAGCATDVEHYFFSKRLVEVDERLDSHGERIDRVEGRVARLEITVTEMRDHSLDAPASSRGSSHRVTPWLPAASVMAPEASRTVVTVHVPFGFNRADLDGGADTALASVLTEINKRPGAKIELEGATDSAGQYDYNVRLSQRRVAAVERWLMQKGVARNRIIVSISRGPLADPVITDAAKRRVLVKLMSPPEKKVVVDVGAHVTKTGPRSRNAMRGNGDDR